MLLRRSLLQRLVLSCSPTDRDGRRFCRQQWTRSAAGLIALMLLAVALTACAASAPESGKTDTTAAPDSLNRPALDGDTPASDVAKNEANAVPDLSRKPLNTEIRQDREIVPANAADAATPVPPVVINTSCKSDKDCTVKNVGNCCGEYPACVNVASPTDPAGVQAQCGKQGMASICGFPTITGCTCKAGTCESAGDSGIVQ